MAEEDNLVEKATDAPGSGDMAVSEAEETPVRGRAAAMAAYKMKYADRFSEEGSAEPNDDEMYDEYMREHAMMKERLGKLEEANGKYADREMKFVSLIDNNPDLQELLSTINEDDKFLESIKERKARFAMKEKNGKESVKNILAWQAEAGMSDEERIARVRWIVGLAESIDDDIISKEIWESAGKAINYDTDMNEAVSAAAHEARNAGIEQDRLSLKKDTELFPDVNSGSSGKVRPREPKMAEPKKKEYFDELETVK